MGEQADLQGAIEFGSQKIRDFGGSQYLPPELRLRVSDFLGAYRRYAVEHGHNTLEGDSDATSAAHDLLQKIFVEIVEAGQGNDLFRFYDDPDPWVQSWAASHTLEIDEARALAKLTELERAGISHISTSAKYTIQGWKSGELRFLS